MAILRESKPISIFEFMRSFQEVSCFLIAGAETHRSNFSMFRIRDKLAHSTLMEQSGHGWRGILRPPAMHLDKHYLHFWAKTFTWQSVVWRKLRRFLISFRACRTSCNISQTASSQFYCLSTCIVFLTRLRNINWCQTCRRLHQTADRYRYRCRIIPDIYMHNVYNCTTWPDLV